VQGIIEFFFMAWATDRSLLSKRGRPPKEIMANFGQEPAETAKPNVGNNNNNNNNNSKPVDAPVAIAPPAPKQPWWKGLLFGKKAAPLTKQDTVPIVKVQCSPLCVVACKYERVYDLRTRYLRFTGP
jgi:hypothetical protein